MVCMAKAFALHTLLSLYADFVGALRPKSDLIFCLFEYGVAFGA